MADSRYKTSASCVYSLKYHLVWCPKYRKKVLVGRIEARLRELLYEKANNMGVEIEALEIMPDHVHRCFCWSYRSSTKTRKSVQRVYVPIFTTRICIFKVTITNSVEQVVLCRQCWACFRGFCETIHCESENEAIIWFAHTNIAFAPTASKPKC